MPLKAMIFDFQTLRYSSPMVDLTTFMSNSTGVDVRSQHFPVIFQTYHNEVIENYCKGSGVNINNVPDYLRSVSVCHPTPVKYRFTYLVKF